MKIVLLFLLYICSSALLFGQEQYFIPSTANCPGAASEKNLSPKETALRYDESGFASYQRGDIEEAAQFFFCAVTADETLASAHYNLACMYALLWEKYKLTICDGIYISEIFHHLSVCINLNPAYRSLMANDPDFNAVRGYSFFKLLALNPHDSISDLLVQAGTWYGPRHGVFPASPEVQFFPDGTVRFSYFLIAGEGPPGFGTPIPGTYKILSEDTIQFLLEGAPEPIKATIHCTIDGEIIKGISIECGDHLDLSLYDDPCGV
jgi:hypothetical protein